VIGIDSNVLIRFLTRDDPAQARVARHLITDRCARDNPGFVDHVVLCEVVWVLQRGYRYHGAQIAQLIEMLLSTAKLLVENEDLVHLAVSEFRAGADFSDDLISRANQRYGCEYTVTFGQSAARGTNFRLLK
jgi:predicted nucleic-acid-binding protein